MRPPRFSYLLFSALLLSSPLAVSAEDAVPADAIPIFDSSEEQAAGLAAVPEPPAIPEDVESGEPLEPEITITRRGTNLVEEYRLNGRLYKVKITPSVGAPYYLVDNDGDGKMEPVDSNDIGNIDIPQWVLFSW